MTRHKRALVAVAVSAAVALGVATPMALRVGEGPVDPTTTTTTASTTTSTTSTTSTTLPAPHVLSETTIRGGD